LTLCTIHTDPQHQQLFYTSKQA